MKIQKKGNSRLTFVVGYAVFLSFVLFMLAITPFGSGITASEDTAFAPPECVLTGTFLDIFGIIGCGLGYIGFFFGLMFISSEFALLSAILITPLIIGLGWSIAEWLRGV